MRASYQSANGGVSKSGRALYGSWRRCEEAGRPLQQSAGVAGCTRGGPCDGVQLHNVALGHNAGTSTAGGAKKHP